MRCLPPLNALRTFEACARCLSLTAAARELCVTHSAVSHQIRQLESWFGQPLFVRHAGGIHLTRSGEILQRSAGQALAQLEQTCQQLRQAPSVDELVLGAPASFLANWLIPRLEQFEQAAPGITLRLQTRSQAEALLQGSVDLLIVSSNVPLPSGLQVTPLLAERTGPVCAPSWQPRPDGVAELLALPRLHTRSHPQAWRDWAHAQGQASDALSAGRHFDTLSLMLEAAAAGLGVAIAPDLLVEPEISRGRLLAPLGFTATGHSFASAVLASRAAEPALAQLLDWLQHAAGQLGEEGTAARAR